MAVWPHPFQHPWRQRDIKQQPTKANYKKTKLRFLTEIVRIHFFNPVTWLPLGTTCYSNVQHFELVSPKLRARMSALTFTYS